MSGFYSFFSAALFPSEAINWCLLEAGISLADVKYVALNQDSKANLGKKIIYTIGKRPSLSVLIDRFQNKHKEDLGFHLELQKYNQNHDLVIHYGNVW